MMKNCLLHSMIFVCFLFFILILIILLSFFSAFMFYQSHHDIFNYLTIYDEQLPSAFNDFRVFFISDIHRRHVYERTLRSIKEDINVIIIGGDITEKGVPLERTKENLEKLKKWNLPIYFVWGNNDYEEDTEEHYHLLEIGRAHV